MGLSLIGTKRRIKTVGSTRKITKAMELVSTSKQKRAKDIYQSLAPFSASLLDTMSFVTSNKSAVSESIYFKNKEGKKLKIIICSSLGLCGGYNLNTFKFVFQNDTSDTDFIIVGERGHSYFKNIGANIIKYYEPPILNAKEETSKYIASDVMSLYQNYSSVSIVYTKFVNSMTMNPNELTLLPISPKKSDFKSHKELLIEPSAEEIINNLVPFYVQTLIKSSLLESMLCEEASRRMAMENASDNADELLDKLLLEYNKSRQGAITNEISEISGAANAQGR